MKQFDPETAYKVAMAHLNYAVDCFEQADMVLERIAVKNLYEAIFNGTFALAKKAKPNERRARKGTKPQGRTAAGEV